MDKVKPDSGLKNIPPQKPKKLAGRNKKSTPAPKPKPKDAEAEMMQSFKPEAIAHLSGRPTVGIDLAEPGGDKSVATLVAPTGLGGELEQHVFELFDTPKRTLSQRFWGMVWNASEHTGISLGRYAPAVFGKMIGSKPREVR